MAGIQFTGLASGLDTDSIVKAMLATQQSKIDSVTNDKTKLEWKKDQWKTVNASINKFYSNYVDKLRYQSTFESYSATTSTNAVDVKITGDMPIGAHKVTVEKLATEVSEVGNMKEDVKIDSKTKTFKELGLLKEGEKTKLIVGREFNADGEIIEGKEGKEIEITESDTLASLEKKIKEADDSLNVNFDIKNKKLFISSKETGTNAKLNIDASQDTTGLFEKIGLSGTEGICGESGSINKAGSKAIYTYNGITLESDTNEVEVNGLSLTLKEVQTDKPVTIEVKNDVDKVVDFIGEFVGAYNELIGELNELYNATKISLSPLSDTDKEGMTEKEINEYEQSIKDSLLRRDSSLKQVIDTLRSSMQSVVKDNKYGCLSAIGITTGNYSENGKLILDKDKLKKALQDDPDAVKELFVAKGESTETSGIGNRLNSSLQDLSKRIEGVKSYQSFYNDKVNQDKIEGMAERISTLKEKYTKMEKLYYKKFTAMEKALSTLNSQSTSFLSMLG